MAAWRVRIGRVLDATKGAGKVKSPTLRGEGWGTLNFNSSSRGRPPLIETGPKAHVRPQCGRTWGTQTCIVAACELPLWWHDPACDAPPRAETLNLGHPPNAEPVELTRDVRDGIIRLVDRHERN